MYETGKLMIDLTPLKTNDKPLLGLRVELPESPAIFFIRLKEDLLDNVFI